jgi:hypothetical protein
MQNLQSKTPYKFKKSYGGTPEPQTPQDAPWLRGPSLKIENSTNMSTHGAHQNASTTRHISRGRMTVWGAPTLTMLLLLSAEIRLWAVL